jgi:hypothetical protein
VPVSESTVDIITQQTEAKVIKMRRQVVRNKKTISKQNSPVINKTAQHLLPVPKNKDEAKKVVTLTKDVTPI